MAVLAGVTAAGGLLGAIAQAEIAGPGLQVLGSRFDDARVAYVLIAAAHGGLLLCLPWITIALCLAIVSDAGLPRYSQRAGFALAISVAFGVFVLLAIAAAAVFRSALLLDGLHAAMDLAPGALVLLAMLALARVVPAAPAARTTATLFTVPALLMMLLGFVIRSIPNRKSPQEIELGDYVGLAADHAFGVAILLCAIGAVACWAAARSGRSRIWFCLVSAAGILASAAVMLLATVSIAYTDFPRRFVTYPPTPPLLSQEQARLALWAGVFGVVVLAVIAWLAILIWRQKKPPGVETAFE